MADFSAVQLRTARAVVYRLSNRMVTIGAANVPVIYDDGPVPQDVGGIVIESTGPRFVAYSPDLPSPITGSTVTMPDASTYQVRDHQPSGTGTSLCLLHRM